MVTSNNTITQLMTGMLFLFSEGKPQSIKIDTPFVKSFRLKRGNLIPNQSYDNEKIIFEIAKKMIMLEHPLKDLFIKTLSFPVN